MPQPFDSLCLDESHYICTFYLSISMLFHVLHILSILIGPNIFLSICLSKVCRLFSSFAVKVQVSDEYVMTGIIIILYIFILVFILGILILFCIGVICSVTFCYSFSNFYVHFIICIQNRAKIIKFFHTFKGKIINF